jgi:hypothetical protein
MVHFDIGQPAHMGFAPTSFAGISQVSWDSLK